MIPANWVFLADIVDSKKIDNRRQVQNKLKSFLKNFNDEHSNNITVPFEITLGDEFLGVFNSPELILEMIMCLYTKLPEIYFRFGIGTGEIEKNKDGLLSGKAYNNASRAVRMAKNNNYNINIFFDNLNNQDNYMIVLDILLHLMLNLINCYTYNQIYILHQLFKNKKQKEIASTLQVSQSSISQSVQNINWRLLKKIYYKIKEMDFIKIDNTKESIFSDSNEFLACIGCWDINNLKLDEVNSILEIINNKYSIVKSRFLITVQKSEEEYEFQGLLDNCTDKLVDLLLFIIIKMDKLKLGIGQGNIKTDFNEFAIGMDGSSFYRARNSLEKTEQSAEHVIFELNDILYSEVLSDIFSLVDEFISGWTKKQSEIVLYRMEGLTQSEIADKYNIKRVTVTDHLASANWSEYYYLYTKLLNLFSNI
ncbi:MAG: SatD family protein [Halanaerobiaceae bacterium]